MPTSARHALPSPASTAVPDVPVDIKASMDAIDVKLPYVNTSTPTATSGLIWRHPTTGVVVMGDGTSFFPISNGQLIGGRRRTTSASASSGTTELLTLDTPGINLLASSLYRVDATIFWDPSQIGDRFIFRIRQTNVAGAILVQVTEPDTDQVVPYGTQVTVPYVTTSAEASKVFALTVQRLSGSGSCTVTPSTMLTVSYLGPSTFLSTV